jgi:hypothetical protein
MRWFPARNAILAASRLGRSLLKAVFQFHRGVAQQVRATVSKTVTARVRILPPLRPSSTAKARDGACHCILRTQQRIFKYSSTVPSQTSDAAYQRDYYARNKEALKVKAAARYTAQMARDPDGVRARRRAYHDRLKNQVLDAYGARCTCCGESNRGFLSVDHVNGGGRVHRKTVGGGTMVYLDIIKREFPAEFQLLCFNCNLGRELNGGVCPHVAVQEVTVGLSTA